MPEPVDKDLLQIQSENEVARLADNHVIYLRDGGADAHDAGGWARRAVADDWQTLVDYGHGMQSTSYPLEETSPAWPFERDSLGHNDYFLMDFRPGSVRVRHRDQNGSLGSRTWRLPVGERADGTIQRALSSTGVPVYPQLNY